MKKTCVAFIALLVGVAGTAYAGPTTYQGVTFPEGDISFADAVYSFAVGANVAPGYDDPTTALGAPDYAGGSSMTSAVSLGDGGSLVVEFVNNYLTASGDAGDDLYIFEAGDVETMSVDISKDASTWISVGIVSGQPSGIDIDAYVANDGAAYYYVRIEDVSGAESPYPFAGPDIDAVGAISTVPMVPAPGAMLMVGLGTSLVGFLRRRKVV